MWQEVLGYVLLRVGLPSAQCVTVDGLHSTQCYSQSLFVLVFLMSSFSSLLGDDSMWIRNPSKQPGSAGHVLSVKCCVHIPCCSTAEQPVRFISPCLLPAPPFPNSSDLFYSLSLKGSLFQDFLSPFGTVFISLCNFCCSTRSPAACWCLITSIGSYSIFNIVHVRKSWKALRFRYKEWLEISILK